MQRKKEIKVGIGFATGRKSFQKVLRTYIYSWNESGLVENERISLNLFIAYDLDYNKTKKTDYTNMHKELVEQIDSSKFIESMAIKEEIDYLTGEDVIDIKEAGMIFGKGYAAKRNAVLYYAIKHKMDYLIFLDDDEYPMAATKTRQSVVWGGQHVLSTHLKYITQGDITVDIYRLFLIWSLMIGCQKLIFVLLLRQLAMISLIGIH